MEFSGGGTMKQCPHNIAIGVMPGNLTTPPARHEMHEMARSPGRSVQACKAWVTTTFPAARHAMHEKAALWDRWVGVLVVGPLVVLSQWSQWSQFQP